MQKEDKPRFVTVVQTRHGFVDNAMPNILEVLSSRDSGPWETTTSLTKQLHHPLSCQNTPHCETIPSSTSHSSPDRQGSAVATSSTWSPSATDGRTIDIPRRTTSMVRPAKRRRHQDLVAFHRNSCQLFSSLDGALAKPWASSSSSSTSSSTSSSAPSSPASGHSTRDSSLDSNFAALNQDHVKIQCSVKAALVIAVPMKRPTLQRMSYTVPATSPLPSPNVKVPSPAETLPHPKLDPPISISRPKITTTQSYCSTHALPQISTANHSSSPSPHATATTTIHWTSPETRQREYTKIDAANSGLRLFLRTIFPRSISRTIGGGRGRFCNEPLQRGESDDADDAKSVRRFRVSVENDDGVGLRCLRTENQLSVEPTLDMSATSNVPDVTDESLESNDCSHNERLDGVNDTNEADTDLPSPSSLSNIRFRSVSRHDRRPPTLTLRKFLISRASY